ARPGLVEIARRSSSSSRSPTGRAVHDADHGSGQSEELMRKCSLALMMLMGGPLSAQRVETGFLDRTVTLSGTSYHYQVYVPANYTTQPKWPVILFLHGAGERGSDGLVQTAVGLARAIRLAPGKWPAIVVFPQAPTDSQWVGTPADMA